MQPWEQIQALRKSGQLEEALEESRILLEQNPGDYQIRSQVEWIYFDLIKQVVARIGKSVEANTRPDRADFDQMYDLLKVYGSQKPAIPGMATSNVLNQLAKIGRHFDRFVPFLIWCGPNCLRPEDLDPNEYQGGVYPSWGLKLAREAAAWVKARPDATVDQVAFVLNLARAVQQRAKDADKDKIWLEWSMIGLLRRAGDHRAAAELIVSFLKRKRAEFWVWAEAARIHREEQPELAIACFCQALRLGNEPKYLVKAHRELAELLADSGDSAQATRETLIAAGIYDQEGWRHPPELSALLQSDWYDPSITAVDPSQYYAKHADEALELCFDEVREYQATYLGMTEGREGKKPKPRYAYLADNGAVSILGRRGGRLLNTLQAGSPVMLLIGIEDQRRDVLEVHPRPDGSQWDCTESGEGVISQQSKDGDSIKVYCGRDREAWVPLSSWPGPADPAPGNGVRAWGVTNPASGRFEVHRVEPAPVPQHADIGIFRGVLRRTSKGFGFVDDVFVPAPLLDTAPQNDVECAVVAVQSFDKTKQRHSWRAVAISPCQ